MKGLAVVFFIGSLVCGISAWVRAPGWVQDAAWAYVLFAVAGSMLKVTVELEGEK